MRSREAFEHAGLSTLAALCGLLLAFMPLLGMRAMVCVIGVWLALTLADFIVQRREVPRTVWPWMLVLCAPFLLMLADIARASDALAAWHIVERSAALAIFPIGFLVLGAPSHPRFRNAMMGAFTGAALLLSLCTNAVIALHGFGEAATNDTDFGVLYRHAFSSINGLHPPYAAYFFLSAALFQTARAVDDRRSRWWRVVMVIVLFASAALLASRTPLIAFTIALMVIVAMRLRARRAIQVSLAALGVLGIVGALSPSLRSRAVQALRTPINLPSQEERNSVNERVAIMDCTYAHLQGYWLFGMGQANVQPALDRCYTGLGLPMMADGSYGTHCQPLHWWMSFGIAGLLAFIVLFAWPMRLAWKERDAAWLGFLLFMLICCATENVLARQWGVVLFACFNALFLARHSRSDLADRG